MTPIPPAAKTQTKNIAWACLELGRVLADRNGVVFRAKGTCMYPTIRAGDILRIKPCRIADVSVGDIAIGRKPGYLFAHRVIAKGSENERDYIITRPDIARSGDDGPTFNECLLGRIQVIERNGRPVPLLNRQQCRAVREYYAGRRILIEFLQKLRSKLACKAQAVQTSRFYMGIAKGYITIARPKISYTIRLPMKALGEAVYRQISPEEFDTRIDWRGRPLNRWTLTLHVNGKKDPAASATFSRKGSIDWDVSESFVSAFYRGMGLDDLILRKADCILKRGPVGKFGFPEGKTAA
jgi:hypothetical protein